VVLVILYGQTRIFFAMCRDGLLPQKFATIHPRFGTPARLTLGFGILISILAALVPLSKIVELVNIGTLFAVILVNIGTLFAFILVNIGVVVLRHTKPDMDRPFRTPLANPRFPLFPIIGVLLCGYLVYDLPGATKLRFVVWLVVGLIIYFTYSRRHSKVSQSRTDATP
jgi:APA family basic amino acid/polyamine antiporter